jgi:hypothetical protein
MEDARKGIYVEVPFDETIVKFLWKDERVLEIVDMELSSQFVIPVADDGDLPIVS